MIVKLGEDATQRFSAQDDTRLERLDRRKTTSRGAPSPGAASSSGWQNGRS
jgi:hypothetical protein